MTEKKEEGLVYQHFRNKGRSRLLLILGISNLISLIFNAGNYLVKMKLVSICRTLKIFK